MLRIIAIILPLFFFVITACSQSHPNSKQINDALGKAENEMKKVDLVKGTASAFDGKKNIKFRIMVEDRITMEQAENLTKTFLNDIAHFSNQQEPPEQAYNDVWKYYNASFDIKSYKYDVLYEGSKKTDSDKVLLNKK